MESMKPPREFDQLASPETFHHPSFVKSQSTGFRRISMNQGDLNQLHF